MKREELTAALENYRSFNEQEEADRLEILRRLRSGEALWTRDNPAAHFTVSAWIVSPDRRLVLMCYHMIYNSWSWLGGHLEEDDTDLLLAALREVKEESGLRRVSPVTDELFSVEILTVDGHEKRGKYVSSHLHLNLTFLVEADPAEPLTVRESENAGLQWFPANEAVQRSSEPWFRERIYSKLNAKVRALYGNRF